MKQECGKMTHASGNRVSMRELHLKAATDDCIMEHLGVSSIIMQQLAVK